MLSTAQRAMDLRSPARARREPLTRGSCPCYTRAKNATNAAHGPRWPGKRIFDRENHMQNIDAQVRVIDPLKSTLLQRALGYERPATKIVECGGETVAVPIVEHVPPEVAACVEWLTTNRPDEWRQ